jgi:arylsulfatase A-like enzyme
MLLVLSGATGIALAAAGYAWAYRRGAVGLLPVGRDAVIFIVTDNVRADRTSLCGFDAPTTPALEALAAEPGAIHSCRAYAPGSWTLPSHASYFTGLPVVEHKAHEYEAQVADPDGSSIPSRRLLNEFETLAETFRGRGYQTVLMSGNPVVGAPMGLAQGFDVVRVAGRFGEMDDEAVRPELAHILRDELNPVGGPLFLTVNLAEAHRPWDDVPAGHPFLRAQSRLQFTNTGARSDWRRYLEGEMSEREAASFLDDIANAYTWGVQRADGNVQAVLDEVRESGWCRSRCRIVVTSDHGEHIGEHGLVDHGFYSWEANARVYLVAAGTEVPALPEPVSALVAWGLVRDGRLPDPMPPVEQWAWPHVRRALHTHGKAFNSRSVARWSGWLKDLWQDGTYYHYDLQSDPGEQAGPATSLPPADFAALRDVLDAQARREGSGDEPSSREFDEREALKAAGYLE